MLGQFVSVIQNAGPAALFLSLLWVGNAVQPEPDSAGHRINRTAKLGARQRWFGVGVAVGIVAALTLTILRETTSLIHREWVALGSAITIVAFATAAMILGAVSSGKSRITPTASTIVFASLASLVLFAKLPAVFLQFTSFIVPGQPIVSTEALLRVLGFMVGTVVLALTAIASAKVYSGLARTPARALVALGTLVFVIGEIVVIAQVLFSLRIIKLSHHSFMALVWAVNHQGIVIFSLAGLTIVGTLLGLKVTAHPKVSSEVNVAQTRLAKAHALAMKRFAYLGLGGVATIILAVTVGAWLNEYTPELSEPEPFTITNGQAVIDLETVSDGHLHRFSFTTSSGIEVRFIVVMRNGVSYGVGLDACDICGDTGYYERDGNIICRLCDVIMNIATIGFKGGCNPIPLDHQIDAGHLTIDLDDLEEVSDVFA